MDENRWPRPGPGMVVMFAVVGLIVGILAGLFNPAGSRQEPGQGVSDRRAETANTQAGARPETFYTVVLASVPRSKDRSEAEARAEAFRGEGVKDVDVLDPERYSSVNPNYWAVISGTFESGSEATAHQDELRSRFPDLAKCYLLKATNGS